MTAPGLIDRARAALIGGKTAGLPLRRAGAGCAGPRPVGGGAGPEEACGIARSAVLRRAAV